MNISQSFLPRRNLLVTGLWLILGATSMFSGETPPTFRTGLTGVPGAYSSACVAALLLTPEQTATLQSLWESRRQEILRIRGSSKKMSLEQQQQINAEEKMFDQKRNDVLTTSQCDIILLINDISKSVVKTCSSDFKARADATFTKEEKAAITAELSKAIKDAFQAEMKASLPAERFAAYQAALGKH